MIDRNDTARQESLQEWREYLDEKQREAAEADPFGHCKTKMPMDAFGALTYHEREEMLAVERASFAKYQPLAQAKHAQRRAWISSGGDEASFERHWREQGKDEYLASKSRNAEAKWRSQFRTL